MGHTKVLRAVAGAGPESRAVWLWGLVDGGRVQVTARRGVQVTGCLQRSGGGHGAEVLHTGSNAEAVWANFLHHPLAPPLPPGDGVV